VGSDPGTGICNENGRGRNTVLNLAKALASAILAVTCIVIILGMMVAIVVVGVLAAWGML
jgi:hypothetical protein